MSDDNPSIVNLLQGLFTLPRILLVAGILFILAGLLKFTFAEPLPGSSPYLRGIGGVCVVVGILLELKIRSALLVVVLPMISGILLFSIPVYYSVDPPLTPTPTSSPTRVPTATPTPAATLLSVCPGRIETGPSNVAIEIRVERDQVAYLIGWGFDGQYGGFFIAIYGPYAGTHIITNGVYCPPVPANTEQARATKAMLERECDLRCPTQIIINAP